MTDFEGGLLERPSLLSSSEQIATCSRSRSPSSELRSFSPTPPPPSPPPPALPPPLPAPPESKTPKSSTASNDAPNSSSSRTPPKRKTKAPSSRRSKKTKANDRTNLEAVEQKLSAPALASKARQRAISAKPARTGTKAGKLAKHKITPMERVAEYPLETLNETMGMENFLGASARA